MPKGSRRLTPKQRAQRRRRRDTGAPYPIAPSIETGLAPSAELASPQSASEQASPPPPAAVSPRSPRASRSTAAAATPARAFRPTLRQDPFLMLELRRIGLMSVCILAILIALSIVLS